MADFKRDHEWEYRNKQRCDLLAQVVRRNRELRDGAVDSEGPAVPEPPAATTTGFGSWQTVTVRKVESPARDDSSSSSSGEQTDSSEEAEKARAFRCLSYNFGNGHAQRPVATKKAKQALAPQHPPQSSAPIASKKSGFKRSR
eukprot:NODE_6662_length_496_cov_34.205817_g5876_i0.p2 GENE.NODE_6662_length_496_cov_34.205817_g5876_i0~~NODE_6662_length_496_cov_34.205817_g5876_i0.p2  ORF type:complete len:143 (-),score=22.95 NODE_6662_length_496_cov_34.205817_g5876_i0:35-463(-)